jgi:D-alanyl-D-alanine carboxypeptidase
MSRGLLGRSWIALVLAASLVATGACRQASEPDPDQMPDLERALELLSAPGAVGLLRTEDRVWRAATGDTTSGRPAQPGDRFGIASITKTFVATVVLQLVDEGLLSLQDSVEDVLPGALPYGGRISVRQLLNHSSGLDDAYLPELSPRETLEALAEASLMSRPGTEYSYANVNYTLLGVIVEEVTGDPLERVVRDRIFTPLALDDTSFGRTTTQSFEAARWLGYRFVSTDAAGGIVSTVDDVATFFRALLAAELIDPDLLSDMTRTIDGGQGFRAGLGIFELDLSCGTAWGHGGELPTYSSMAMASRDGSKVVVIAQSTGGWTEARDTAEEIYCS